MAIAVILNVHTRLNECHFSLAFEALNVCHHIYEVIALKTTIFFVIYDCVRAAPLPNVHASLFVWQAGEQRVFTSLKMLYFKV